MIALLRSVCQLATNKQVFNWINTMNVIFAAQLLYLLGSLLSEERVTAAICDRP